jgi:hypothetical protein
MCAFMMLMCLRSVLCYGGIGMDTGTIKSVMNCLIFWRISKTALAITARHNGTI